jgi:photosystem II stability/assembly factor-like uncharacterized protein
MSSDGVKQAGAAGLILSNVYLYTSANTGTSWTQRSFNDFTLANIVSSSDGTKLAATTINAIYTSSDSGASWTLRYTLSDTNQVISDIAMSADGTDVVVTATGTSTGGNIYTSANSGVSWTVRESLRKWTAVASSSDGTKLAAVVEGGAIYTSINSGVSWTARASGNRTWTDIATSADGSKLVATVGGLNGTGQIYTSNCN